MPDDELWARIDDAIRALEGVELLLRQVPPSQTAMDSSAGLIACIIGSLQNCCVPDCR